MAVDPERDTAEDPLVFQVPGVAEGRKVRMNARPRGLQGDLDIEWFYEIPIVRARFFSTKPWIYDNTETTVTSPILAGSSSGLTWPLTWPLVWGTVTASSFTATNDGTSRAEFVATIPGERLDRLTDTIRGRTLPEPDGSRPDTAGAFGFSLPFLKPAAVVQHWNPSRHSAAVNPIWMRSCATRVWPEALMKAACGHFHEDGSTHAHNRHRGARLTQPPLPHHPACGSAPGGSRV